MTNPDHYINLRAHFPAATTAIFDMDDLMINSHPLHMKVFESVLEDYGVSLQDSSNPWTAQNEASMFGLKVSDAFKLFIKHYNLGKHADADAMRVQFDQRIVPIFEAEDIQPMPGLIALIDQLRDCDIKLALASSARREKIDIVLGKLGLNGAFLSITSGEDEIKHGKPAPDIFLTAAGRVNSHQSECMVFEDAENGIDAGRAAHMSTVGVHNRFSQQRLGIRQNLSHADLQTDSLANLSYFAIDMS